LGAERNSTTELCALGIAELAERYRNRSLSPVEVTQATLDRIAQVDPSLNSFVTHFPEAALASAKAAEQLFQHGIDLGPLQGVPGSIKDLIRIRGARTTCASPILVDAPIDPSVRYARGRILADCRSTPRSSYRARTRPVSVCSHWSTRAF
jgi:Asp-tRNA(Asn)/Glu-tRNA(Gln) amidotransferase A subunit family amidase